MREASKWTQLQIIFKLSTRLVQPMMESVLLCPHSNQNINMKVSRNRFVMLTFLPSRNAHRLSALRG